MRVLHRVPGRFWVVSGLLISVNAAGWWLQLRWPAGGGNGLRVISALPKHDVDKADRFSLIFDEPQVEAKQVGGDAMAPPFRIEPHPPGRWVWAAADRLEYQLTERLRPGRRYTIRPAAELEARTGRRLIGQGTFHFATQPLRLAACKLVAADRSQARFELRFNQPVDPTELNAHLRVFDRFESAPLKPEIQTNKVADRITVQVPRPESDVLVVHVGAKLAGSGGELALETDAREVLQIAPVFAALSAEVFPLGLEKSATVRLEFSRRLGGRQAPPQVTFDPPISSASTRISGDTLVLEAPFQCGQRYRATVSGDLLAADGEALGKPQTLTFEIPDREPSLSFTHSEGTFMPSGNLLLDLQAVNVGGVRISASRVHANNLSAHLHDAPPTATSRDLPECQIPLDLKRNVPVTTAIDLRRVLRDEDSTAHADAAPRGIYRIHCDAIDQTWTDETALVTITDLAISTKRETESVFCWITSLSTGMPVAGASVSLWAQNNQPLARGTTLADGTCRVFVPSGHPDGVPWLVVAESGADLHYARLDRQAWRDELLDTGGRAAPTSYDAMLFTDRGIYRPGETVRLAAIVREAEGAVPPSLPLRILVTRPDGRMAHECMVRTNDQGMLEGQWSPAADAMTGPYRVALTVPDDDGALAEVDALVEAFVPARLDAAARTTAPCYKRGEEPQLQVTGRYLFGQPAARLPVSVTGIYRAARYVSRRFAKYTFGVPVNQTVTLESASGTLDEQGATIIALQPPTGAAADMFDATCTATVTEPGARSISRTTKFQYDPYGRHVGLHLPCGGTTQAGRPIQLNWVTCDGKDTPLQPKELRITLSQVEHDEVLEMVNGRQVWKSVERLTELTHNTVRGEEVRKATGTLRFDCGTAGRYRIMAVESPTGCTTQVDFLAADDADAAEAATLGRPETVEIEMDAARYRPGSTANLVCRAPFAGCMWLCVESDRVYSHQVIQMESATVPVTLRIPGDIRGGAFITATVVRAIDHTREQWRPHRACGIVRLLTDHADHSLAVSLQADDFARPGDNVCVTVSAPDAVRDARPASAIVWCVDEGILLAGGYQTPDPIAHYFGRRAWEIKAVDTYGDLIPDYNRPQSILRIGGDGDDDEASRRRGSPVVAPRLAPVVHWCGIVPLDEQGCANVSTAIPQFTGDLRWMAVVVYGDHYGSADRHTVVQAPLMVEAGWPRFAAPGDTFRVPVKLFNNSCDVASVALDVLVDGPITIAPLPECGVYTVAPGTPVTAWLDAHATGIGPVAARVMASAVSRATVADASNVETASSGLIAHADAVLAVRPASTLDTQTETVRIAAGTSHVIEPAAEFMPGTAKQTITLSGMPAVDLAAAVDAVIDYPHGCVEQTTSRLFAMLHAPMLLSPSVTADREKSFADNRANERAAESDAVRFVALRDDGSMPERGKSVASGVGEDAARASAVRGLIQGGIARLFSMQTSSGGLAYWPGDGLPHPWGSAYATLFLSRAKAAGYEVDEPSLSALLAYLSRSLSGGMGEEVDGNTRAMACRALAECDKPPFGWLQRLTERLDLLDTGGRAHLAIAWKAAGRLDRASAVIESATRDAASFASGKAHSRLTSRVEQDATLLTALLDIDNTHALIPTLVRRLSDARTDGRWGNTLSDAAALCALMRYQLRNPVVGVASASLCVGLQAPRQFAPASPQEVLCVSVSDAAAPIKIEANGDADVYVTRQTCGLLLNANASAFDRQLEVRQRWLGRDGTPVDEKKLRVGDLVSVEVTLRAPGLRGRDEIPHIAIVDRLAAGMEVENPRLATSAESDHHGASDASDRVEFTDDRVVLFTAAGKSERRFIYSLRVTTVGKFTQPAIEAASMYDPAFASRGARREIVVVE